MRIGIDLIPITGKEAGLQRYAQQLIEGLAEFDRENQYVLFLNEKAYGLLSVKKDNFKNIKVRTLPRTHFFYDQIYLPLRALFENLDVLHSPVSAPPIFYLNKSVVTVHDLTWVFYPETMTMIAHLYWNFFMGWGIKRARRIIAVSESTKKDLLNHYNLPEASVRVIYESLINGLNQAELTKDYIERVKKKYELSERYLLYVGILEPRKNIKGLIQAFHKAKREAKFEYKMVIVGGKGWLFSEIFQVVKDLNLEDDVIFTGFVPDEDLPGIYSGAELFVFPSLYEGFGLPPLEAVSYGLPVIISNTSSLPEVIGDAGIPVDPNNPDDIAQAMLRVIKDKNLRMELKDKGLCRIKEFPLERMIRETIKVYEEVADEDPSDIN